MIQQRLVNRGVLILVLIAISALFLRMIAPFLQAIFVAALFAALFTPLYAKLLGLVGDRRALASGLTLLVAFMFVFVPMALILGSVVAQAVDIAESTRPWVEKQLATPGTMTGLLESLPFYDRIAPFRDTFVERLGQFATTASGWIVDFVQRFTLGTVSALLSGMIVLYTMFFFLIDGDRLLYYMLYYLPLNDDDETKLLARFMSVTRATLKGTAVIGFLQGGLAGLALWFAGIPSALFWAVVMMFLSVVPGIGTALIWIPAVVYLLVDGSYAMAAGVTLFCSIVVGTVDNVVRPKLVGNDTQLHELLIFFSTLGGLLLFGFMGFVIGPIIAALFVTVWDLYGDEFQEWLPTTAFRPRSGPIELPHQRLERIGGSDTSTLEAGRPDHEDRPVPGEGHGPPPGPGPVPTGGSKDDSGKRSGRSGEKPGEAPEDGGSGDAPEGARPTPSSSASKPRTEGEPRSKSRARKRPSGGRNDR